MVGAGYAVYLMVELANRIQLTRSGFRSAEPGFG
jgi:hypothetical protein